MLIYLTVHVLLLLNTPFSLHLIFALSIISTLVYEKTADCERLRESDGNEQVNETRGEFLKK